MPHESHPSGAQDMAVILQTWFPGCFKSLSNLKLIARGLEGCLLQRGSHPASTCRNRNTSQCATRLSMASLAGTDQYRYIRSWPICDQCIWSLQPLPCALILHAVRRSTSGQRMFTDLFFTSLSHSYVRPSVQRRCLVCSSQRTHSSCTLTHTAGLLAYTYASSLPSMHASSFRVARVW